MPKAIGSLELPLDNRRAVSYWSEIDSFYAPR